MDVSSIAALATEMATVRTQQAVSMAVLKKALDQQGSSALALLQATAQNTAAVTQAAGNLGQNVDVYV
ncbi:MAG TPA: YjfB family protein [Rhodocyclaceae bacterium]|nr:YjfB family protein [Rhodocyclaceae bacterium]